MYTYNDVMKDDLVKDWFTTRGIKEATQKMYSSGFTHYLNMTGLTPKQLIEEAEAEIKNGTLMRERKIKQYLLRFMEYLKDNVAPGSKSSYFSAVKSFYEAYDIDMPKLKNGSGEVLEQNKYNGMKVEDIRFVLNHTESLKERALILSTISCGMGENEIVRITVGQLKNVDENGVCTLFVRRHKKTVDFITFLSPEAVEAINICLDERNRDELTKVLGDQDYVFITSVKYDEIKDGHHKAMRPRNCAEIMRTICERMGKTVEGTFNPYRPHNWRKFFFNALIDNGADEFFAEFLMGHRIDKTRSAYFKANPEKTKLKYLRFMPFLTIESTETHVIESEEYAKLKADYEELKARYDDIANGTELNELREHIHAMDLKHERDIKNMKDWFEKVIRDPILLDKMYKNMQEVEKEANQAKI